MKLSADMLFVLYLVGVLTANVPLLWALALAAFWLGTRRPQAFPPSPASYAVLVLLSTAYALSKLEQIAEIAAVCAALLFLALDTGYRFGLAAAALPTLVVVVTGAPWPALVFVPLFGRCRYQKLASTALALHITARMATCYVDDRILPLHDARPGAALDVWRALLAGAADAFFWLTLSLQTNVVA